MQTVVETETYLSAAKRIRLTVLERTEIVDAVAAQPDLGALIEGSGGFRKLRMAREGTGKSGGVRVITYWTSPNRPVFLVTVYGKNRKESLSDAEINALARRGKRLMDY